MVLNDDTLVLKGQLERDTAQYGTQQGLGQRIVMRFFSMKKCDLTGRHDVLVDAPAKIREFSKQMVWICHYLSSTTGA